MPLTDTTVRTAKPRPKEYKLFDGGGLYVLVKPNGTKCWRLKYRYGGKERGLALRTYPTVTLMAARASRDEARRQVAAGIDPGQARKAEKAARGDTNSFEAVAREWYTKQAPTWAVGHASKIIRRLERDVIPWLGARPIGCITAPELLAVLRRIESRGAIETAHRALRNSGQVFRYAVATGRCERDPSADLRWALAPVKENHLAAITEPKAVGALLRAIGGYEGAYVTKCALQLAPLVFVRPGELRKAEWAEFDLDAATWSIPVNRMKTKQPHLVPLAHQAVAILRDLQLLTGAPKREGIPDYVFPGLRTITRPMSENTVNSALRRLGYAGTEMCGHGFRAMARTILDEALNIPPHLIEHQLAHAVRDPLGRAYNRTSHLPERRKMMQQWADYLDGLRAGAKVIRLA
ncbi:MAG: integrase arm-type DNA-binding domain-containing protein [Gammaproteobacteria bacterium]|nr:integrase arm-type DNA-binding domain-containing protein [Gammaproteobacteria bacterium]